MIRILRHYKDNDGIWEEVLLHETIAKTEGHGYYKKDTVIKMLLNDEMVNTPFAEYKMVNFNPFTDPLKHLNK